MSVEFQVYKFPVFCRLWVANGKFWVENHVREPGSALHRWFLNGNQHDRVSLATNGDAILGWGMAQRLYRHFPEAPVGQLAIGFHVRPEHRKKGVGTGLARALLVSLRRDTSATHVIGSPVAYLHPLLDGYAKLDAEVSIPRERERKGWSAWKILRPGPKWVDPTHDKYEGGAHAE